MKISLIKHCVAAAALVAAMAATLVAAEEEIGEERFFQFVFHAVLEGLYRDGVSNRDVDAILHREADRGYTHFIYACPICTPAVNALLTYRSRPGHFYGLKRWSTGTFGPGLDGELSNQLQNGTVEERLEVIKELTRRWIADGLEAMNLDAAGRERWRQAMEQAREEGARMLEHYRENGLVQTQAPAYETVEECSICLGASTGSADVCEAGL